MFGDIVEVTGPELTEDEEAENIALAEAAELEWETDHGEGTAVEELVRPSFRDRLGRARSTFSGTSGRSCPGPRSMPRRGTSSRRR